MKVLVCGGRDFNDKELLNNILDNIAKEFSKLYSPDDNWLPTDITIISGVCKGADTLASNWAIHNYTQLEEYPAQWNVYGRSAGFRRNTQMLVEGKPDLVLAFPGGRGTDMMCQIASDAGVEVRKVK